MVTAQSESAMPKTISLTLTGFVILALTSRGNADWVRFRGPNGTGISIESHATPTAWSPSENLKWKVALPGPGSSCPIIVGDRIFVSCWTGYGTDQRDPGQQDQLRRHLLCLDRRSGETIWSKSIKPVLPEDRYGGMFAEHGYASHTPVSDGERVYAFFGKTGVIAFDMQGNQLWQASVGTESGARNWGTASSPLLHGDLLIVPATAESESLVALDKVTGKQVWKQEAAGFNSTWGSPVLATVAGRTDLVIAVPGEIWGLNPATGKLNWYCEGVPSSSFCSSAVADEEGVIYAIESGPGGGGGHRGQSGWVGRRQSDTCCLVGPAIQSHFDSSRSRGAVVYHRQQGGYVSGCKYWEGNLPRPAAVWRSKC